MGYITTLDPLGNYGAVWRITPTGCYQLFNLSDKDLYGTQFKGLEIPGLAD